MRQSQTAVLERGIILDKEIATEPFETAWAKEARWFVQFLESSDVTVSMRTQISADGLVWVDHEDRPVEGPARQVLTAPVRDFGHWLRLVVTPTGGTGTPLTRIYLALKE